MATVVLTVVIAMLVLAASENPPGLHNRANNRSRHLHFSPSGHGGFSALEESTTEAQRHLLPLIQRSAECKVYVYDGFYDLPQHSALEVDYDVHGDAVYLEVRLRHSELHDVLILASNKGDQGEGWISMGLSWTLREDQQKGEEISLDKESQQGPDVAIVISGHGRRFSFPALIHDN